MKRAILALVLILAARAARADQTWTQNQHATNAGTGHSYSLDGLPAAVLGTSPLRLQDVTLCTAGALWVNATALPFRCATIGNTAGGADLQAPLAPADGTIVMPTAGTIRVGAVPGSSVTGTANTVAYFNGSGVLNSLILDPAFTLTTGTLTLTTNGIANTKLVQAPAGSIKGNQGTTTANVQDYAAGGPNLVPVSTTAGGWAWAVVPAAATNGIVANWPINNVRYFTVDGTSGNDTNVCYSDTSLADAGTKACATIAGLAAKFPTFGDGHKAEVVIKTGTYTDSLAALLNGATGYAAGFPLVRGTGTVASAGATAFADDAADSVALGAVTATGMNAAGYNPTGAATTTVIPCTQVGGADPGFPAENTVPLPLGARIRFDSTTATVALRNVAAAIVEIDGTGTIRVPLLAPLPATPTASDKFYIEMPGVVLPTSSLVGVNSSATLVGLRFSGTFSIRSAGSTLLTFVHAPSLSVADAQLSELQVYANPALGGALSTPGGCRSDGGLTVTRSAFAMQASAIGGTLQTSQVTSLSVNTSSVIHDVWLRDSGFGPVPNSGTLTFGGTFGGDYVRVVSNSGGSAFAIYGSKVQLRNLRFSSGQFAYAFELQGKNDVIINGDITNPITGTGVIGFGQTHSAGWKLDHTQNSTIVLLNYQTGGDGIAYQVTGADGDFSLPVVGGIGFAPTTYAELAKLGALTDIAGNHIVFGSSNLDMTQPAPASSVICVGNATGTDIPVGSIVQAGPAGGGVNLAQGDTEAHVNGPLGIAVTTIKNGFDTYRGYIVTRADNYRPILDGTIADPKDLFVSATVPGAVSSAARVPGQPTRRIGHALDTASIRFEPEQDTIWNQQIVNNTTLLTQQTRLRCDGTTIVCSNDGTNFWSSVSVGVVPLGTSVSGTLPATNLGAFTGPVTTAGGTYATQLDLSASGISGQLPIANQAAPTGTGFWHVTGGTSDGAARAVDLGTADVINKLPVAKVDTAGGSAGQVIENVSGTATWTSLPTSLPPSGAAGGALTGTYPNPSIANSVLVGANFSNFAANTLFGNPTGSAAAPTTITLGSGLSFSGGALNVTVAGGADALGTYWVSGSAHAPANAVNWGALGNGVHQQTTSGGVATPSVFTAGANQMAFGAASGGGLQTDVDWTLNPATHAVTGTGPISLQGATTTIGNWSGMGTYAAGVVGAFSAAASDIPYGSGSGGLFTQSSNFQYDGGKETIGSVDGTNVSLGFTRSGPQVVEKSGTGNIEYGTKNSGQSLGFYVAGGSDALLIDGTTGNVVANNTVVANTIAVNSLVKTNGSHALVAATGTDVTNAVSWPNGLLEGAFAGLTSYVIGAGEVVYGSGTAGGATSSPNMKFLSNSLHLSAIDSNGDSITLDRAGAQQIGKKGGGALNIGTETLDGVGFFTNNGSPVAGLTADGDLYSSHMAGTGTRCAQVDPSGVFSPTAGPCGTGGGGVTSVSVVSGQLVNSGTSTAPILGLATSGVSAGTYVTPTIVVDSLGRITSAAFTNTIQSIESDGSTVTNESTLNFVAPLHAADSGGSPFRTNVTLTTGAGLTTSAGALVSQGKVAVTSGDSLDYLSNKIISASGNISVTTIAGDQVNLNVNPALISPSSPMEAALSYAVRIPGLGAGTPGGWWLTSTDNPEDGATAFSLRYEYPLLVAATQATLTVIVVANGQVTDTQVVSIMRNGSSIGSGLTVTSSTPNGTVLTRTITVSGGSTSDTWGVANSGTGSDTSGELRLLATLVVSQ